MMEYIDREEDIAAVGQRLRGVPLLAVDTEAAGYHRYHDRVCLLQLSTRAETILVDTLAVNTLGAIGDVLRDPATELILHDADYDLRLLARDYDIRVQHLFDTKIAAQFLGEPGIGLGALVEKYLGIKLDKKHQRADWAQRPLPPELLSYAAEDTRNLPALRDALQTALEALGRLSWAQEEFTLRTVVTLAPAADGEAYLKMKNTRDLTPRQLGALRELHAWRESVAAERDVAPFRVMNNEPLIELARTMPATTDAMAKISGISEGLLQRRSGELRAAIERARALPDSALPVRTRGPRRPPPDPAFDALAEKLKVVRDKAAERLNIERGFLMPRQQLEAIARGRPKTEAELARIEEMRRWQIEALGADLLAAVNA